MFQSSKNQIEGLPLELCDDIATVGEGLTLMASKHERALRVLARLFVIIGNGNSHGPGRNLIDYYCNSPDRATGLASPSVKGCILQIFTTLLFLLMLSATSAWRHRTIRSALIGER